MAQTDDFDAPEALLTPSEVAALFRVNPKTVTRWARAGKISAIRTLGDSIYHVHAKDCRIDAANVAKNGVLDAKKYTRELERSWIFRTVGYGNDTLVWKDIVSNLRLVGYDHVLSIEHEDSLMSGDEGLRKAIAFLKDVVITAPAGKAYWT